MAYGWDDNQIFDQVEMYGVEWLDNAYKFIQQDKRDNYLMLMSIAPISRTPMEEKGGRWLSNYMRDLRRALYDLTPWEREGGSLRSHYRGKIKSGEVRVLLDDANMGKSPLFKDAKAIK